MQNLRTITQKKYKIAIVQFCLYIAQNCDQSCTNFQFSHRAVQLKFSPPGGLWCHLQIISSCWQLQYGHLDTLNIKIRQLFQEIQAEQVGCKICDGQRNGREDTLLYYIGFCSYLLDQMLISQDMQQCPMTVYYMKILL